MKPLLQPIKAGALELKNRIVMSPLTRSRATGEDGRTPNKLMEQYYVQRASAGLIISEATAVTPMGVGYANTPGIWSEKHVEGWKAITDAVHQCGGKMVLQLWHVGRISHPMFLDGKTPVSASPIAAIGHVSLVRPKVDYVTPRALELSEIDDVVESYRKGAENAKLAGFDGVEIHGANGYLLDQFLQDGSNKRTDQYGGNIENRARLMLEVTDAAISVWGADRVGMHLAPRGDAHSMGDSDAAKTFGYVAEQLGSRKIAFLCAREYVGPGSLGPKLKRLFGGVYIGNENFDFRGAEAALSRGDVDAVAFGKSFIANPDLVERYKLDAALNTPDATTFYTSGSAGYTDYPSLGNTA
ncbi:MAG: alkene reductase [Bdellovibrionales bacterium]|nr:alkene reductase [Bdellovibrionales bacterium]